MDYRLETEWQEAIMVGQVRADQTSKKTVRIRTGEKIGLRSAQDVEFNDFDQLAVGNE